jgi:hypothetical protein
MKRENWIRSHWFQVLRIRIRNDLTLLNPDVLGMRIQIWIQEQQNWKLFKINLISSFSKLLSFLRRYVLWHIICIKYIFHDKIQLLWHKSLTRIRIRIDVVPRIRIRIEVNSRLRIRIVMVAWIRIRLEVKILIRTRIDLVSWIRIRIEVKIWIRIRIVLVPWIRIRIEVKSWIRILIDLVPRDPYPP